jgi:hypothetical protein
VAVGTDIWRLKRVGETFLYLQREGFGISNVGLVPIREHDTLDIPNILISLPVESIGDPLYA